MTMVGEAVVVWTATGITVTTMKIMKGKGYDIPHWLPRLTMQTTLCGSFLYLLHYVLFLFL